METELKKKVIEIIKKISGIKVEDIDFKYTTISLKDVYKMSFKHALQNIKENGGAVINKSIIIKPQRPVAVRFEKGFINHYPAEILHIEESKRKLNENNTEYETMESESHKFYDSISCCL